MPTIETPLVQKEPAQERPRAKNIPQRESGFDAPIFPEDLAGPDVRVGQVVSEVAGTKGVVLQAEREQVQKPPEPWTEDMAELPPVLAMALQSGRKFNSDVKRVLVMDQLKSLTEIPDSVKNALIASGRWYPLAELGAGGMAKVYKAYDLNLRKFTALKFMTPEKNLLLHDENVQRFEREAKSLARLQHENVVTVYDAAYTPDGGYIAMDFVDGGDLSDEIKRKGVLSEAEAAQIGLQIVHGLKAMHEVGVLHRDLKPENVLRNEETGTYQLSDFGLSQDLGIPPEKSLDRLEKPQPALPRLTDADTALGTPSYMSPEQVKGGVELTSAVDLWALGGMLYQMTTGQLPFTAENDAVTEIMYKTLRNKPVSPAELRPGLSPEMNALILNLLSKNPQNRLDEDAVARHLERVIKHVPPKPVVEASPKEAFRRAVTEVLPMETPAPTDLATEARSKVRAQVKTASFLKKLAARILGEKE